MKTINKIFLYPLVIFFANCTGNLKSDELNNTVRPKKTIFYSAMNDALSFNRSIHQIKKKGGKIKESIDSLVNTLDLTGFNPKYVDDSDYLTTQYFKTNLQLAKLALNESTWKEDVSQNDFREYIAPYKLKNELADNWREILYDKNKKLINDNPNLLNLDSLYTYHMTNTYYSLNSTLSYENIFPSAENYNWLNLINEGDCHSRCNYVIYHLRAAGAPATFDILPNWGNRPFSRHAFVGLANKTKQVPVLIDNSNNIENLVDLLNAAMYPQDITHFSKEDVPENLTIQYEKTIPKVYRQTWTPQKELLKFIAGKPKSEIISSILNPYYVDVTNEYLETSSVTVNRNILDFSHLAYLTTFDITGWIPVAYSDYNWKGQAIFKDVGKNILYLPIMKYDPKKIKYGQPFILNNQGKKIQIKCSGEFQDMNLIRKYPLFCYTANHSINFKCARIEGSNDKAYSETTTIFEVDYFPFYTQQINIKDTTKFRYIRFKSKDDEPIRLADFNCFIDSLGVDLKKEDQLYKKGILKGKWNNCFDNDLNSYVAAREIRLDLGKAYRISKIDFTPRNDTNNIIPGKIYELFYWEDGWISAGQKEATSYSLLYKNIPANSMYWLRCLTDGSEERIFTYENNKQIWW